MDLNAILSTILAGGIVGQIVTMIWTHKLTRKRDFNRWLETERHKLFSELLTVVTNVPKENDTESWTYKIRDVSQRIHILFDSGTAPREFKDSLELVFKFAQEKKDNQEEMNWDKEFRTVVRGLRKQMSKNLKVADK
jgi:hypothetical protein